MGDMGAETDRTSTHLLSYRPMGIQPTLKDPSVEDGQRGRARIDTLLRELASGDRPSADLHHRLGAAYAEMGRQDEAIRQYRRALVVDPDSPTVLGELGAALLQQCKVDSVAPAIVPELLAGGTAVESKEEAGVLLAEIVRLLEAIKCLRRAILLSGGTSRLHTDLGHALWLQGKRDEAAGQFRLASALSPDDERPLRSLANLLLVGGFVDEALVQIRSFLRVKPGAAGVHSAYLLGLHYRDSLTPEKLFHEHLRFDRQHLESLAAGPSAVRPRPDPDRRLRVGYVSPDLRRHSVAYFFEPLLAAHDRNDFEVVCYASVPRPDAVTRRLQEVADGWRDVHELSDADLADLIRRDEIDILVDLAGHTLGNRLLAFARKPAPIQVTYLGYPDTTGLATMDYRLTDGWADPGGLTDHLHSERLVRLSSGFLCYRPPDEAPAVGVLPAFEQGRLTFGSFNNLCKVGPEVVKCWADVLKAVPASRLIIKASALGHADARRHLQSLFELNGVATDRVTLLGETPGVRDHLNLYNQVDVALDTFPYHGTTTTCEALWMGVPVVTRAGRTHASRVGVSLLTRAGVPELIAASRDAYVELAVRMAADWERLGTLRAGMRDRLRRSALMDAEQLTRSVERAYRSMWQGWCRRAGP